MLNEGVASNAGSFDVVASVIDVLVAGLAFRNPDAKQENVVIVLIVLVAHNPSYFWRLTSLFRWLF